MPSLVEIGAVVLKKKTKTWKVYNIKDTNDLNENKFLQSSIFSLVNCYKNFILLLHAQNPIVSVTASHWSGRLLWAFDGGPTIHRVGCVHPLVADTKRPIGQGQHHHVEVGICNDKRGSQSYFPCPIKLINCTFMYRKNKYSHPTHPSGLPVAVNVFGWALRICRNIYEILKKWNMTQYRWKKQLSNYIPCLRTLAIME